MFVLTEPTPNPEAMKFIPDAFLTEGASGSFEREGFDAALSPLAARIFAMEGPRRVFVARTFVTVTRSEDGPSWSELRYPLIEAIADHLQSGDPALAGAGVAEEGEREGEPVEDEIRQVLGLYVRPGVARDGGDVLFERFDPESGVLWIRMQGACGGCPSARLTLKAGVERIVRRYVPEVLRVEETAASSAGQAGPSALRRWLGDAGGGRAGRARTVFTHAGRAFRRAGGERRADPQDVD